MKRLLVNCYSDSHSLRPSPTVHLQMKEIVVPHVEHKVYDKETQEQVSCITKITTIPLSSDNQTILSSPILLSNRYAENPVIHNPQQQRQNKIVDKQHLLQPNHLSSLLSLSSPSLISTPISPCIDLETTVTNQQMKSSVQIQKQQQSDSFSVIGLLSHSDDCDHTGDVEQFVFLETAVNDLSSRLTSRTVSPRNHVEVDVTNNPK
jgi:hypothetical protein